MKDKKIIITGATGFIGRNVTRALLNEGARVFAVVRKGSKNLSQLPQHANLTVVPGELCDIETLVKEKIGEADVFLHFAWRGVNREEIDSQAVQSLNVEDSVKCLKAAVSAGCGLFMDAGSRVEYGITADGIMAEDTPCHPVNEYGKAKLLFYEKAAEIAKKCGITYYHLRFFSVYGKGDHPWSIISTLTRELPKGNEVSLSACLHRWNFMHIDDASAAVCELIKHSGAFKGVCAPVNVAGSDTRVLKDFVLETDELTGHKGKLSFGTFVQAKEGALSVIPVLSGLPEYTENAFKEQVSFAEGIKGMLSGEGI